MVEPDLRTFAWYLYCPLHASGSMFCFPSESASQTP